PPRGVTEAPGGAAPAAVPARRSAPDAGALEPAADRLSPEGAGPSEGAEPRPLLALVLRDGLLHETREVGGEVHRPDDRAARPDLDDRDAAELAGPHPEALERQVEQAQQHDLEDAVVGHEDRPRLGRGLVAVAADLRGHPPARRRGRRQILEDLA